MEQGLGGKENQLFPIKSRLKEVLRDRIDESIFHGARVSQQVHDLKKRIVINVGEAKLPYMAWSAGQREFMPLLFSLYWLMPSVGAARRKGVDWVIIEEPEMGLHPQAIQSVLLIWHGGSDSTVNNANADSIVRQWQKIHKVEGPATRVEQTDGFPRQVWCNEDGREVIEEYIIGGMGHGTPIMAGGDNGLGEESKYRWL